MMMMMMDDLGLAGTGRPQAEERARRDWPAVCGNALGLGSDGHVVAYRGCKIGKSPQLRAA